MDSSGNFVVVWTNNDPNISSYDIYGQRYDADGNFQKHGISQDASSRYSEGELDGGFVTVTDSGTRKNMITKERDLVETDPGPLNKEPWAGSRSKSTTSRSYY